MSEKKPPCVKFAFGITARTWGLPMALWIAPDEQLASMDYKRAVMLSVICFDISIAWNRRTS